MGHTSCGGTEWNYQRRAHSGHLIPSRLIDGHWGGSPRDFSKAGTQWPLNTFSADCRPFGGETERTSRRRVHSGHLIPSQLMAGHSEGKQMDLSKAGTQRPLKPSRLIVRHVYHRFFDNSLGGLSPRPF